jgi:hypothetical protein
MLEIMRQFRDESTSNGTRLFSEIGVRSPGASTGESGYNGGPRRRTPRDEKRIQKPGGRAYRGFYGYPKAISAIVEHR